MDRDRDTLDGSARTRSLMRMNNSPEADNFIASLLYRTFGASRMFISNLNVRLNQSGFDDKYGDAMLPR